MFLQVVKEILMKFGDEEDADDKRMALWPWGLQHGFGAYFEVLFNVFAEYTPFHYSLLFPGNA